MNSLNLLMISFMMGLISISGVAYSSSGSGGKGSSDSISKSLQDDKNKQTKNESKSQETETNAESVSNNVVNNISNKDKDQNTNGSDKGSEQQTGKMDTGINLWQVNIMPLVIEPETPVTLSEKLTGIFDDVPNKELLGDAISGSDNVALGKNLYKDNMGLEADIKPEFSEHTLNFNNDIQSPIPEPETYMMLLAGLILLGLGINRENKSNRKAKISHP